MSAVETPTCDDLVIEELNTHWDDELSCVQCDKPATVRLMLRCCMRRLGSEFCDFHCAYIIEYNREWLELGIPLTCKHCKHRFEAPQTVDDVYQVAPL